MTEKETGLAGGTLEARDGGEPKTSPLSNKASADANQVQSIPLSWIKDSGAQMRVEMRVETVNDYATDMLNGVVFPPVVVFHDGNDYWLGDGFHRVEAARKIGSETIVAEIRKGSARDAILHGVGSNASHGLRRTQADKRRAVERLLKDSEWARWSDRKIAEAANVDHKTVGTIRRELSGEIPTTKRTGDFPPSTSRTASQMVGAPCSVMSFTTSRMMS